MPCPLTSAGARTRTASTPRTIEFQAAYRHPSVGAVIDRPQKYDEFQNKVPLKVTFSLREM